MTNYLFNLTQSCINYIYQYKQRNMIKVLKDNKSMYSKVAAMLCLIYLAWPCVTHAQTIHQFELSKTMNESKMGYWTKGNYTIYIDLNTLESNFRASSKQYNEAAVKYTFADSNAIILYKKTGRKYLEAADILSHATNGFDLRKIRFDTDSAEYSNIYTLPKLENLIMQNFTSGKAALYYKGQRVYICKSQTEFFVKEILDHGMTATYYSDTISDFVF
jgi:hypothetical protein